MPFSRSRSLFLRLQTQPSTEEPGWPSGSPAHYQAQHCGEKDRCRDRSHGVGHRSPPGDVLGMVSASHGACAGPPQGGSWERHPPREGRAPKLRGVFPPPPRPHLSCSGDRASTWGHWSPGALCPQSFTDQDWLDGGLLPSPSLPPLPPPSASQSMDPCLRPVRGAQP